MSSILHSLRTLFGSPSANNADAAPRRKRKMTRARARRIARGEEENDGDSSSDDNADDRDDDVFSAFGEADAADEMMQTQEGLPAAEKATIENKSESETAQPLQQQHEAFPSPLMQEFFRHITASAIMAALPTAETTTVSHKEWNAQRRQFLMGYFTLRLIGVEEGDDYVLGGNNNSDECDRVVPEEETDSSFHSGILDEDFDDSNNGHAGKRDAADSSAASQDSEDEELEIVYEEEEEPLQTQQERGAAGGIFSGIKRKLGFLTHSQEEQKDADGDENKEGDKRIKKTQQCNNNKSLVTQPGQMWDGNFSSIPHISDTTCNKACFQLKDMDLLSSSVTLGLCRIIRVWNIRWTKRMNRLNEEISMVNVQEKLGNNMFGEWEDDGPLNTIYKKVFSIEVVQLDDDNGNVDDHDVNDTAPFHTNPMTQHHHQSRKKATARKRRHTVRRVRIFFYNKYADVMHTAFQNLCGDFVKARRSPVLLSLTNVPPECIMPMSMTMSAGAAGGDVHPHLQQYVNNPFGDEEWGVSSPYCICIGDRSTMKLGDEGRIRFDGEGMMAAATSMEIRLVEAPFDNGHLPSDDVADDIIVHDAIITSTTICTNGAGYFLEAESELIRRYLQFLKRQKEIEEEGDVVDSTGIDYYQNSVFNAEEYEMAASAASRYDVQNVGIAGLRGTAAARGNNNAVTGGSNAENTDPNANSGSSDGVIIRPRTVVTLGTLPAILLQGRKDPITVYGIVLGFSPPRITRMNMWMMSIVLIDETMPTSREREVDNNNKELHVPSITLNLFVKNKSELPPVRSAGDVICCQKVVLQEYNNEPQLRAKKNSNIIVARPRMVRCPENPLHNSTSPDDWAVSDGSDTVDLDLANSLWRWGQRRLSTYPTMSPSCYLAISQVSDHVDNFEVSVSGDVTAVVTSMLPTPEHLRRSDTPRGFLRLWDGTGPSRSDPMPEGVSGVNVVVADPPEQVLIRIEKILKAISSLEQPDTTCSGVNAPLALCGRVINAIIWEEDLWNLIQRDGIINIGSFVRLRNINNAMLPSGSRVNCLSVHAKSSLTPLPYDAYEVKMLLKGHDTRLKRGVPTNPTSAILPGNPAQRPQFAREAAHRGFSMLDECLRKPAPATFTIQFEVSHTLPASDLNSIDTLKAFCVKQKDGNVVFRFAMHIKDASSEVDVICHGKVAEELLGITAQDVSASAAKCTQALGTLKDFISSGSVCEGKIRSVMGKDKRVYFVLCSMFCITS